MIIKVARYESALKNKVNYFILPFGMKKRSGYVLTEAHLRILLYLFTYRSFYQRPIDLLTYSPIDPFTH
jgi:hypothetical protein